MAIFKGPFNFDGSVGGFRGYWDSDAKKQVLSSKKDKNKNHNKHAPRALDQNREFKAVSIWSKLIRIQTYELTHLKKGRLVGLLNRIAKQIQLMDSDGLYGYKKIESSKFNYPLIGFSFNNAYPFKDVFQMVPELSITEDRREVTLKLTDFRSDSKFRWPERILYYRIYLLIFDLPDVAWKESWNGYYPVYPRLGLGQDLTVSDWIPIRDSPIDFQISAAFRENQLPKEKSAVVVVMGLEFASAIEYNTPYVVKDYGTAAIVGCL